MSEKIRKRIKPIHIKFLKKFEVVDVIYDKDNTYWRVMSTVSPRTHVTNQVKLIHQNMRKVDKGKYRGLGDNRVPQEELERRIKVRELRDRYNHWMDVNGLVIQQNTQPLYSKNGLIKSWYYKTLARYMICENL